LAKYKHVYRAVWFITVIMVAVLAYITSDRYWLAARLTLVVGLLMMGLIPIVMRRK
jgi:hypothetical protein